MMLDIAIDSDGEWDSSTVSPALVRRAAEAAIAESAFPQLASSTRSVELSVRFGGDDEVRVLNAEWRDKDKPTNVLSFPMAGPHEFDAADDDGPAIMLGDIILAHGVCAGEAAAKGVSLTDHAAHLLVHGTLHLLGYDHQADPDASDMEAREVRALARLGIADPYAGDN
jgi:probable rRNA maturation factor